MSDRGRFGNVLEALGHFFAYCVVFKWLGSIKGAASVSVTTLLIRHLADSKAETFWNRVGM